LNASRFIAILYDATKPAERRQRKGGWLNAVSTFALAHKKGGCK
jgi:hypothetical protein